MDFENLKPHLKELRLRILLVLIFYITAMALCMCVAEEIYGFLLRPLFLTQHYGSGKMIFTGLADGMFLYIRVSIHAAFYLSIPFCLCQLYKFLKPGLYKSEKKALMISFIVSPTLFTCGLAFAYYFVIPIAWDFLSGFQKPNSTHPIILEARVDQYLDLMLQFLINMGLAFQMPVILAILARFRFITYQTLILKRRIAIVIMFIIGAILTPPDVISQVMLAIPLVLLYEISIIAAKLVQPIPHKY